MNSRVAPSTEAATTGLAGIDDGVLVAARASWHTAQGNGCKLAISHANRGTYSYQNRVAGSHKPILAQMSEERFLVHVAIG
jgi:hypothetical protein